MIYLRVYMCLKLLFSSAVEKLFTFESEFKKSVVSRNSPITITPQRYISNHLFVCIFVFKCWCFWGGVSGMSLLKSQLKSFLPRKDRSILEEDLFLSCGAELCGNVGEVEVIRFG